MRTIKEPTIKQKFVLLRFYFTFIAVMQTTLVVLKEAFICYLIYDWHLCNRLWLFVSTDLCLGRLDRSL